MRTDEVNQDRRGRRRSDAADQALLAAALDVLATQGFRDLTMGAVIERAGTSSATLYRRWPTKGQLVGAALATLTPEVPTFDTGSLLGDLAEFIDYFAAGRCMDAELLDEGLVSELGRDPDLHREVTDRFIAPRIDSIATILDRAHRRGEIGTGVDGSTAYSLVIGPVHHRSHVLGIPLDDNALRVAATSARAGLVSLGTPVTSTET